ncbi:MFS transporter [Acidianus sp. RZ1]|uniref:MFS transporter n=1 Tax=Acidianus sp. RZ1 TaxID=1540082 RepID=UPI001C10071C|nr:MFS transporter [Acidianus sp. RZ1]
MTSPGKDPKQALKVGISANLGWGFELFDFVVYLYASTIIAPLFFPSNNYYVSVLETLLALVIGYFARPFGAIFFGHFGDRLGRKRQWFLSLLLMGLATIFIGFLPTYAQIGIMATILLVILRMLQGFFLAGEWGGGMTFVAEVSPDNRRGLYGGIQQGGAGLGLIFAVAAYTLASFLAPGAMMETLGWRIMFWFGAIPLAIALAVRWGVDESFEWLQKGKQKAPRYPFVFLIKKYWKLVIVATLVMFGVGVIYYGSIAYMPDFLGLFVKVSPGIISTAVLITNLMWLFFSPIAGYLSDKLITRKGMLAVIFGATAILLYPIFLLLHTGVPSLIYLGGAVLGLLFSAQYSILPAWLAENISTAVRYTYISFVINLGVAFSSFAPFLATFFSLALGNAVLGTSTLVIVSTIVALLFVLIGPRDRVAQALE